MQLERRAGGYVARNYLPSSPAVIRTAVITRLCNAASFESRRVAGDRKMGLPRPKTGKEATKGRRHRASGRKRRLVNGRGKSGFGVSRGMRICGSLRGLRTVLTIHRVTRLRHFVFRRAIHCRWEIPRGSAPCCPE